MKFLYLLDLFQHNRYLIEFNELGHKYCEYNFNNFVIFQTFFLTLLYEIWLKNTTVN